MEKNQNDMIYTMIGLGIHRQQHLYVQALKYLLDQPVKYKNKAVAPK